jgi:DNA-binding NtrC family response regulator
MPELDGLQVIDRVRGIDPEVVIAVITGYATIATAVDAMKAGAYDFLPKPFTPDELRLVVSAGASGGASPGNRSGCARKRRPPSDASSPSCRTSSRRRSPPRASASMC